MADTDFGDAAMIALYPPAGVVSQLVTDGGPEPDDLHCTVAYLGDAADVDEEAMLAAALVVAKRALINGVISGHARFTGGPTDVAVALVDSAGLEWLRRDLADALTTHGIEIPAEHGYVPHITMAYIDPDDPSPVERITPIPIQFESLSVVHGTTRTDLSFCDPDSIADLAREAFAAGWASADAPMTDRVKAGCVAAIEHARQHPDDPDVLEVTLQLGALEGMWAKLFDRREQVYTDHTATVMAAWKKLLKGLDTRDLVQKFRAQAGLAEADDAKKDREATATALAVAALLLLLADTKDKRYKALLGAIVTALKAGNAEGTAGAIAIAANDLDDGTVDFDQAYADTLAALADDDTYGPKAAKVLGAIGRGLATDIGRRLTKLADTDATEDEMVDDIDQMCQDNNNRAVAVYTDIGIGKAISAGALAVYAALNVLDVNWVTAGDSKVCVACQQLEDDNPHAAGSVTDPPLHGRCRCILAPANPVTSLGTYAMYLLEG